jgi:hypothetical protein
MDPVLIMDDIIEKLHLLDIKKSFNIRYKRPPISRTYFAISCPNEPAETKVRTFVEICYWLMSLSTKGQSTPNNKSKNSKSS